MTVDLSQSQSMEETNNILKESNLPSYEEAFVYAFRIRKKVEFTVAFGDVKAYTQQPYFSTSAGQLNHIRTDYNMGGQCQGDLLTANPIAMKFYKKWDVLHTKNLTHEQLKELLSDIEELKNKYPYVESGHFSDFVKLDREISNKRKGV